MGFPAKCAVGQSAARRKRFIKIPPSRRGHAFVQCGASDRSLGFEDEDFGSSSGWWAASVATYCPSRLGELPKFLSSKPCE